MKIQFLIYNTQRAKQGSHFIEQLFEKENIDLFLFSRFPHKLLDLVPRQYIYHPSFNGSEYGLLVVSNAAIKPILLNSGTLVDRNDPCQSDAIISFEYESLHILFSLGPFSEDPQTDDKIFSEHNRYLLQYSKKNSIVIADFHRESSEVSKLMPQNLKPLLHKKNFIAHNKKLLCLTQMYSYAQIQVQEEVLAVDFESAITHFPVQITMTFLVDTKNHS